MTAEEKTVLAHFLDLAGDYAKDGYARTRETPDFQNDVAAETEIQTESIPPSEAFSSLPLAYQVEEDEGFANCAQTSVPPRPRVSSFQDMPNLITAITGCKACPLCATRTHAVPGEGADNPLVMVIGEGPGADEDAAGRPFVGRAGQLLDKMLASIGLSRDKNCYIANMVKCRPPGNRDPEPDEIAACLSFLSKQIALLRPRIILCAGRVAARNLLKTNEGINALRGTFAEYRTEERVIPVLCTFHPSALLRDESLKRPAWEDLKLLRAKIESLERENTADDGES